MEKSPPDPPGVDRELLPYLPHRDGHYTSARYRRELEPQEQLGECTSTRGIDKVIGVKVRFPYTAVECRLSELRVYIRPRLGRLLGKGETV